MPLYETRRLCLRVSILPLYFSSKFIMFTVMPVERVPTSVEK